MTFPGSCQVLVQNDEYWLPYALESVRGVFNRYVLYDVGSDDNTWNIIDWFVESETKNNPAFSYYVRKLPNCTPDVQGIFRNAMIAEGQSAWYFILDGDEVYNTDELKSNLGISAQPYGVLKRMEFNSELTHRYDEIRTHHRLYRAEAIWKGTHPGEEPVIDQKAHREFHLPITCYHFHNAERSRFTALKRNKRKHQHSYHPGTLEPFDLLEALPILRSKINNFDAALALERLQHEFANR